VTQIGEATAEAASRVNDAAERYNHGHERPLAGYGVVDGVYLATVTAVGLVARRMGKRAPELSVRDIAVFGIATHRMARTITKDSVTSPLRMPFTRYEGRGGPGELQEKVVARQPVARAVGELVTCPFCMAQWVATGFVAGAVFAPRLSRLVAAAFASVAVADFLHFAYARASD
jgi:hypothetical protein